MKKTPTDPLYIDQWHFGLIGDIETIWSEYDGTGVTVVVYDDGIDYNHTDLDDNYDASMHFTDSFGTTYDPATTTSAHGTAVAGLIGAEWDNDAGGTGVAPGVTMTAVNFIGDIQFQSDQIVLESLAYAQNFDIMNNSWGEVAGYGWDPFYIDGLMPPTQDPDPAGSLGDPTSRSYAWEQEYLTAAIDGRGGLGTIIVQAAGNDGTNASAYGLNNSRLNITVGATDEFGAATSYSNWGTSLLISAPAGSVTTDLSGRDGTNTTAGPGGDYMTDFSGTSAATPIVSGVVALMLEANPGLGWRDVQNILALSASMTGSVYGNAASGNEMSTWAANGATNWNGGGNTFNLSYGFGMIDAFAAVRMAEAWFEFYNEAKVWLNEEESGVGYSGSAVAINDAVGGTPGVTEMTLNFFDDFEIENIQVTIDVTHASASDLVFWLVAPDGTEIPFMIQEGYPYTDAFTLQFSDVLMENGFNWTFEVTAYLGMSSAGDWTLRVEDHTDNAATGVINDFQLYFYGAAKSTDTVYHYTSDFLELAAVDNERTTLSDTDGGTDWLNFVAIADDVDIDLGLGTISVNQTQWQTIAQGSDIENVATGDGADNLLGNALNNELRGGRGNDLLDGKAGNDFIFGEAGDDTITDSVGSDVYSGGAGNDLLLMAQPITAYTLTYVGGKLHIEHGGETDLIESDVETVEFGGSETYTYAQLVDRAINPPPAAPDVATDLNADGTSDLLWINASSYEVGQFQMSGGSPTWMSIGTGGANWTVIGAGDFDYDGDDDILFINDTTLEVGQWEMQDGANVGWARIGVASAPAGWEYAGLGDVDGDGDDDILWQNSITYEVGYWDMQDGGNSGWQSIGTGAADWVAMHGADFDGDGDDDIVWYNTVSGEIGSFEMENGQNIGWNGIGGANLSWRPAGYGDFDGDGDDDILWQHGISNEVVMFEMQGGAQVGTQSLGTGGTGWSVYGTGDYDGDGDDDILWHNPSTGETGMFVMESGVVTGWDNIGQGGGAWQLFDEMDDEFQSFMG